jgi:Insertion element 4 transposase N-terminal/Transposase DDE domain
LSAKSAMAGVVRSITVAAGVFAPGHLGPLTQVIPFELVDAVLEENGRTERRLRMIPARVALYLTLAMALFEPVSAFGVWDKLTGALRGVCTRPSEKALRDARRRIGVEPLKALCEVLCGPIAQPGTPGARYRGYRTVAFDGCSSTKIRDTPRNRALYGPPQVPEGHSGYPMLRLMTLVETGSRALIGAVFGPCSIGELAWAEQLLDRLDASMLLLNDRGFDADDFLAKIAVTKAAFLVRARRLRRPPVLAHLPDGSYLTLVNQLKLRVIEAKITITGADGTILTDSYRLLTTLLDHRMHPAPTLAALYHERWEIETAYLALRHTLLDGRVLRSGDPTGLAQEMWAILTVYQALRTVMCEAAEHTPGTDPDRMSFTLALETARTHTLLADLGDPADRLGPIGRAVLATPNPPRRARYSQRKLKSSASRYSAKDPTRPSTSTPISDISIHIEPPTARPVDPLDLTAPRHRLPPAATPPHTPTPPPTKQQILALLRQHPGQPQRLREIAAALGISGRLHTNRLGVRLSRWHHQGLLTKTEPGTYMIKNTGP